MEIKIKEVLGKVLQEDLNGIVLDNINMNTYEKWDSLSHLKIIIGLEEEFDIEIEPDEIYLMRNGATQIKEIIEKKKR